MKKNKLIIPCCSIIGFIILIFIIIGFLLIFWPQAFFFFRKPSANIPQNSIKTNTQENTSSSQPQVLDSQEYKITEKLVLKNIGVTDSAKQIVYLPKFQTINPYQTIISENISPKNYELISDNNGNKYLKYTLGNLKVNETRFFDLEYTIKLNHVKYNLTNCAGPTINEYKNPETYLESDNQKIINQTNLISKNSLNQCEISKAIYNWVGDNITYPQYFPESHGALWTLENKQGDCTDFSDLTIALNRAAGIPATFLEGLAYTSDQETDPGKIKHDWLEVYLPSAGWVPEDPTWGRYPSNRDKYFANIPADHAILTRGRNLEILNNYYFYYYEYFGSVVETQNEFWQMQKITSSNPLPQTNTKSNILNYFKSLISNFKPLIYDL